MKKFDVCILGGGAGGSLCAIELAKNGVGVCVIDQNDFPAKKLLVTGNGRCNLTNKNMSSDFYNQNIDKYLKKFSYQNTIDTFKSFGLETYFDEEGRCYPLSNSAKSVCFVIEKEFEKYDINYEKNQKIIEILLKNKQFLIKTEQNEFVCSHLVIATGHSVEVLDMAKELGEKTKNFVPTLVALKTKENTKRLSGERVSNVKVSATIGNKKFEEVGEVLFKDDGLSGICIFNLSTQFVNTNYKGQLEIDLLPDFSEIELQKMIIEKLKIFDNASDILRGIFSKELSTEILKRANILPEIISNKINNDQIRQIVGVIKHLSFEICGCYDNNQICDGGVLIESLTDNLESKVNRNLYFCGEICDVGGLCGGYNLQWAFTSAEIVAKNINGKYKK